MQYVPFLSLLGLVSFCFLKAEGKIQFSNNTKIKIVAVIVVIVTIFVFAGPLYGKAEEIRKVEVIDFDLANSFFVVKDEDSFEWYFKLGKFDLALGEEYRLVIDDNNVFLEEIPEAEYVGELL